ncbi:hypothetical protein EJ05DRAFT_484013 [Pseudovirgaria hyperparasitica]|uniref:Lysine-specific metallo-endopeptidase domain-containing protein n=1 Tax=Pseudovirgaria hyperparasitica TaxID=470096 RepID=A0A6A6WDX2_9PEZI|nr:uncharacterized protein EJ05DRAFT_484013 [Pseudovirgaria hyperparasitica]KAF2760254.1 hypothetical protein EJ05DRAFT_484013 [Pseudovirgaria hyperparasitica]
MILWAAFAVFASFYFSPSLAVQYDIDSSCSFKLANVGAAIEEAILMARRSVERLDNAAADHTNADDHTTTDHTAAGHIIADHTIADHTAADHDIGILFSRIFHTTISDQEAVQDVRNIMDSIANITRNIDGGEADLTLYCDNDARWQQGPGTYYLPTDPHFKLPRAPACRSPGTLATMYSVPLDHPRHDKLFAQITVCDRLATMSLSTLQDYLGFDWSTGGLMDPTVNPYHLLSVYLLHELTHFPAWQRPLTEESGVVYDVGPNSYWWQNIIQKPREDALINADNYAFFGLLAHLGDSGLKLSDDGWQVGTLVHTEFRPMMNFGFF